jgi:hypothetical protein
MSMPISGAPAPPPTSSSRGTTALVLGIIGVVCCQICAPFAWYIGNQEVNAIKAGTAPIAGEGAAKAGMILGVIGTVLLALSAVWILFFGGMTALSALSHMNH